ncbi:MAG: DOMON domain-containing protein [Vulcanimicrobiaceae bacterium]
MFAALIAAVLIKVPQAAKPPPLHSVRAAGWENAAHLSLAWDLQGHKPAPFRTTVLVSADAKYLYVAFEARQSVPVVATQHTNDVGFGTDDDVTVDLWPAGANGFSYEFAANPIGTHYQSSSENSAYEPTWWSYGRITPGGYEVTMKIPLDVMRGAVAGRAWLAQFSRSVESTGDILVWSYNQNETSPNAAIFAGRLSGIVPAAARPEPRLQVYNLGSIAGASVGGSTARTGVDLSVPFTATSSFYATIHPDYSNVELDQQTISPTAYRRMYQEVRPFFTQGQQAYDNFMCAICSGIIPLYTPAIPTPRDGYAVEGTQGAFQYGAFDAVGKARIDQAQAIGWHNGSQTLSASFQRVGVDMPGFHDDTNEVGVSYGDNKHIFSYFNYGADTGSRVADGARAQLYDLGAGWYDPTTTIAFSTRKIGQYFNPYDGYIWHPDVAGWGGFLSHAWLQRPGAAIRSITVTGLLDRYHDHTGELDQTDQSWNFDLLTRGLVDVNFNGGSSYLRLNDGSFAPVTQNTLAVTLGSGAQNTSVNNGAQHGQSATPTTLAYSTGRFGGGRLDYWSLTSTRRAGRTGSVSLELDRSDQFMDAGPRYEQWLERVAYTLQSGPNASFALGLRRIMGTAPVLGTAPVFQTGWNLSAAYHQILRGRDEIYAVYGDASAFSTVPQFIVKWIHYFGAAKGT